MFNNNNKKYFTKNIFLKTVVIYSFLISLSYPSDSIFDPESLITIFLGKSSICVETSFTDANFAVIHFSFTNTPQDEIDNIFLSPYLMKSEANFWKNIGKEIEEEHFFNVNEIIYERQFAFEKSLFKICVKKFSNVKRAAHMQKYQDFEKTEDLYIYLGNFFKYEVLKKIEKDENVKNDYNVSMMYS